MQKFKGKWDSKWHVSIISLTFLENLNVFLLWHNVIITHILLIVVGSGLGPEFTHGAFRGHTGRCGGLSWGGARWGFRKHDTWCNPRKQVRVRRTGGLGFCPCRHTLRQWVRPRCDLLPLSGSTATTCVSPTGCDRRNGMSARCDDSISANWRDRTFPGDWGEASCRAVTGPPCQVMQGSLQERKTRPGLRQTKRVATSICIRGLAWWFRR